MKLFSDENDPYGYDDWKHYNEVKHNDNFTLKDVFKKFSIKEIINAIGIDKIELIIREEKIKKIKSGS